MTDGLFIAPRLRVQARQENSSVETRLQAAVHSKFNHADSQSGRSCAFIVVPNFVHLRDAYGLPFALALSREIRLRLRLRFVTCESTDLVCLRDDCFLLWTNAAFIRCTSSDSSGPSESLENLLALLGRPVHAHGVAALPHIHADWIPVPTPDFLSSSEIELLSWAWTAQPLSARQADDDEGRRLRADMDAAVRVSKALAAGRIALWWQPVVDAHAAAATFYREACARFEPAHEESGEALVPSAFMPCLERLGLARMFDRQMMRRVIEALRLQPTAVLAVNISAQSATLDHWWASLWRTLAAEPDLARRLVVVIHGGIVLPDIESAREFCAQLRRCGCRIAIGDFAGNAVRLDALLVCRPDIVKLDASLVRRAREDDGHRDALLDMLQMCGRLAPHVIVDGIDGEDDLQMALQAGARWMQGYYLGGPDVPARKGADPRLDVPVPAQASEGMLLPGVLALTGACAAATVGVVLLCESALSLPVIGLWSGAAGIGLQRAIFGEAASSEDALERSPCPLRTVLASLGITSGLAVGLLMSGRFAAALCVGAGLVLGLAAGALCARLVSGSRSCLRALRRMQLPLQPACDPAARALACAEVASGLLRRRAGSDLPTRAALTSYMDGVASGFYGLHPGDSQPPELAGARVSNRAPSMLAAIWREGVGHGGRIRSQLTGSAR